MDKKFWLKDIIFYVGLCICSAIVGALLVSVSMLICVVDALCRKLQGKK